MAVAAKLKRFTRSAKIIIPVDKKWDNKIKIKLMNESPAAIGHNMNTLANVSLVVGANNHLADLSILLSVYGYDALVHDPDSVWQYPKIPYL